ncbi:carbohydrate ABC transporter permease [Haladaptatus pallidirubidus]|uniref:Sugar ABC transporter permease n=1 Tax=Haladaptatus pallidirubidus TaxID=1008152 RepID=A0AAV3UJ89_9EURY|nr:sugar ABC transporter permease [Haladaptatus pallidirubidus]
MISRIAETGHAVGTAVGYRNLSKKGQRTVKAGLLLSPVLLWLVLYKYLALGYNVYLSFSEMSYTGEFSFVGLANWQQLANDPVFFQSLFNTVVLFATIPVSIAIALGIAILLNQQFPGNNAFRSLFFLPYITMMVAIAVIWQYMFKTDGGVINYFLLQLGVIESNISWFGDSTWALVAIFAIQVWKTVGFYIVILLAGLQTIPEQVYQVAKIDGATRLQRFLYLTLPLLKSTIGVCMLVGIVISFRLFDLILVLTNGGPGNGTEILLTWIYKQAFLHGNFGYAAALSVVMIALAVVVALIGRNLQRSSHL